ncbi:hypothetical protein NUW58_g6370 [Xylaria curta]|uniref:Uncharacterized protein n=1 Tax=Xylaria curta TaxID=42375 RepID=A0ACC1NWB7_9PEZI|nr:hypothetical protein NUW58_g6370 [Xylaria curta]
MSRRFGLTLCSAGYILASVNVLAATGLEGWETAVRKANDFIAQLNLTEKVGLTTGNIQGPCTGNIDAIPRLNFSGLCLQDGPLGLRQADLVSEFPAGISTGPLGRHPLGGRNWEGFAADPYLSGVANELSIQGIQDAGVQACVKHFVGNEQETHRSNEVINGVDVAALSSNIDDRTLHEVYVWPFANAVRAGAASVMCSYNRLDSTYACENSRILNEILRDELGFPGYVMSDWFATHSGVPSVKGGLDMTMPGPTNQSVITDIGLGGDPKRFLVFWCLLWPPFRTGTVNESRVDDMARRIMAPYFYLRQDQPDFPTYDESSKFVVYLAYGQINNTIGTPPARDVRANGTHAALIRTLGAAGTVLLKNVNGTLPLKNVANVGVFGSSAPEALAAVQLFQ